MGKAKKMKLSKPAGRNPPLAEQIIERDLAKPIRQQKQSQTKHRDDDEVLDKSLTKKILEQAKSQQAELEEDFGIVSEKKNKGSVGAEKLSAMDTARRLSEDESASEQSDNEDETYYEHIECDEEDEKAMSLFMSKDPPTRKTLGDIIMEKISEKKTELMSQMSDINSVQMQPLDDRIVQMYRGVRDILSKYRSGKLPKAFKIIPSLANWEQILYLTEPDNWTAAAMYQATRIFTSNLNAKMAQRFFNLVLLPRIRDDICEYKKLNPHLYMALKKSLFKPAAFFKGVLLPLCESGTCTLREAVIIASVLAKCSVPVLHASAAILKIAEMDYTGANSIFLRTLFDKKYALPYRVIDAVVFHYLGFRSDKRQLPVLWHQSLLSFVQRYKEDISAEQKESLLELLHHQCHELITPEIRRELTHSKSRGEEATSVEAMQQV